MDVFLRVVRADHFRSVFVVAWLVAPLLQAHASPAKVHRVIALQPNELMRVTANTSALARAHAIRLLARLLA